MELRVVFVLSVIACGHYLVFLADGRQIKPTDDDSKRSRKTETSAMHEKSHELAAVKGYGRSSIAGHRLISGRKQVLPSSVPDKSSDVGVSVNGYKDGFRPTTPGNSPGIGHSFEEDNEETEQKPAGSVSLVHEKHFNIDGYKDGFRPTTPGNSPGAGHSFQEDNEETEQKPAGSVSLVHEKYFNIDGYKDGFRPTTPGNSPGAGHSFQEDDEETETKHAGRFSSINDKHFNVAGDKEGFRPTNPGHSPGIGHASEPNA